MAQQINLGSTLVPAGQRVFTIDNLPVNSSGFELRVGIGPTWLAAAGTLFTLKLELALDSVNFREWIGCTVPGGPSFTKGGAQLTEWVLRGTWPGEHDGSQNRMGRRVLRGTDLRVTLTVAQPFTATSVIFRAT